MRAIQFGRTLFFSFLLMAVLLPFASAQADGINSGPGVTLPMGAGGTSYLYLTPYSGAYTSYVGLWQQSPQSMLDVNGDIRMAYTSKECTSANEGAQRYNHSEKLMEFCDGTSWHEIGSGPLAYWDRTTGVSKNVTVTLANRISVPGLTAISSNAPFASFTTTTPGLLIATGVGSNAQTSYNSWGGGSDGWAAGHAILLDNNVCAQAGVSFWEQNLSHNGGSGSFPVTCIRSLAAGSHWIYGADGFVVLRR